MLVPLPVRSLWETSLRRSARRPAGRAIGPTSACSKFHAPTTSLSASNPHSWHRNSSLSRCPFVESQSGHSLLEPASLTSVTEIPTSSSVSVIRSTSCPWLQNECVFSFTVDDQCDSNTSDKSPPYTVSTSCSSSQSAACLTAALRLWSGFRVHLAYKRRIRSLEYLSSGSADCKRAIRIEYFWNRLNSGRA